MVRRDAARQGLDPGVVPEDLEILAGDRRGTLLHDEPDLGLLLRGREPQPGREALPDGVLAARTGEDEVDRREQSVLVERVDDREAGRTAPAEAAPGPPPPR
ncbi:hypothetical protein GCM10025864_37490 [Luteimicrobium album]|uniref:Uncharacterized protein n=1 Tax=Luteimicrobium album TaxID=1054550 RepID=A0ABQ6I5F9_9MICO|nr:hypothetical protein GCM10025864_37490 [Luteimicrobium album]